MKKKADTMNLQSRIRKFNSDLRKYSPVSPVVAYIDLFFSVLLFGASFDDYIRYRFWEKSLRERNQFVTYLRSRRIIRKFTDKKSAEILENKSKFNEHFSSYLNRNWVSTEDTSADKLNCLFLENERLICKPLDSAGGHGIFVFETKDVDSASFLSQHPHCIVEELIVQHPIMAKPNPTSVNTVRMISVNKNGIICLVAATIRIGAKGSCVDNVCSGGTAASIDMDTGIVFTKEIDEEFNRYLHHPGTDVCMLGVRIPNWECIKNTVRQCAALLPNARYIGWDIAVTEQGCCVIEGNHNPAHSTYQEMDLVGKYFQIVK